MSRYTGATAAVVVGFSLFYLLWPGTFGPLLRRPPTRPPDPAIGAIGAIGAIPAAPDDDGDDE